MKLTIPLLLFSTLLLISCRDKKETPDEVMMPVEADGGIGDGAQPLDSLLKAEEDTINDKPKDSL